jgi:hypothetical protein
LDSNVYGNLTCLFKPRSMVGMTYSRKKSHASRTLKKLRVVRDTTCLRKNTQHTRKDARHEDLLVGVQTCTWRSGCFKQWIDERSRTCLIDRDLRGSSRGAWAGTNESALEVCFPVSASAHKANGAVVHMAGPNTQLIFCRAWTTQSRMRNQDLRVSRSRRRSSPENAVILSNHHPG